MVQRNTSTRLSRPRRKNPKWDDNIQFYDKLRESVNQTAGPDEKARTEKKAKHLLFSDPAIKKAYDVSVRKSIQSRDGKDLKEYVKVSYRDPLR